MKKYLFLVFAFCIYQIQGQEFYRQLSPDASISIITIGQGANLEDSFGHSAIWVEDVSRQLNLVFNYGVFDFDTPNFVLKFASGKLPYKLGISKYDDFLDSYKAQNRWLKAQTLSLSTKDKQLIFDFLQRNAQPENRYYKYDFFYDNCATRPVDVVKSALGDKVIFNCSENTENTTQRDLIHQYVQPNSWGKTGIDIALGSVIDRPASPEEFRFLPDYAMEAFAKAQIKTPQGLQPLVSKTKTLYTPENPIDRSTAFLLSPLFIIGLLAITILYVTFTQFKKNKGITILDTILLAIAGIAGVLITLLWFATDHTATAWNYNLLWAFPFHLLAAFVIRKKQPPQWIYPYIKLALILLVLLFFHWIIGVQWYAIALLPLLIAIAIRYIYILKYLKKLREN